MSFRSSYTSPLMRQNIKSNGFFYGAQEMNISKPLTRATMVAESKNCIQQTRKYSVSSYYYKFPKIPRPKRNVMYYSNWSNNLSIPKKRLHFPRIISRRNIHILDNKGIRKINFPKRFFSSEARQKRQQRRKFLKWWTITSISIIIGGVVSKISFERNSHDEESDDYYPRNEYEIKPHSWQLYAYSTLPLKTISRLWGKVNSIELPIWLRASTYKLYSSLFGVNLEEMEEPDLTKYRNLSEFFFRKLKPGARQIDDAELVCPSDGKILKFGLIENGEIEQVKGMTYSIDALLGLKTKKLAAPSHEIEFTGHENDEVLKRHEEFAKLNGISYTLDDLLGGEGSNTYHSNDLNYEDKGDATARNSSISKQVSVAKKINEPSQEATKKNLYFAVIYLAPGDYHRYHSPTNWVATLRRHFIGELFSVAPFFQKTLQGLFVLNERVALLGYWKHGFFSMVPVGATNVGSIIVNFDKDLKTNDIYEHEVYSRSYSTLDVSSAGNSELSSTASIPINENTPLLSKTETNASTITNPKKLKKNTVYEANYSKASKLLGGYPLVKGQEVGGFKLGSTVVLVFEAPSNFKFDLQIGDKVKMGQRIGGFI